MADYWAERTAKAQAKLTDKTIAETEKQLVKYYSSSQQKIIGQFEKIYKKVFSKIAEGEEVTPADLYKLDTYWQMQGQLKQELQKLGDKQAELFSKKFIQEYQDIYDGISIPGEAMFSSVDKQAAQQMINQIWCADGKSWSSRIWTNTDKLQQALNDNLIDCVLTGKKPSELKSLLQKEFGASYNRADTVVRTEMAHIQTQAAKDRYFKSGITEVEVLVDADERTCDICAKLEGKRYPIKGTMPVPAHPRCRCTIIPRLDALTLSKPYDNMNESKFIGIPASATSGSNEDIREWYYVNIHDIPNRLNYALPLEKQAYQAFSMRNRIKTEARNAMKDRKLAKKLEEKEKILTFNELLNIKMAKDLSKKEAYQDIVRSSAITREKADNEIFGGNK